MNKKGFFKTIISVCSGTEEFPALIQQPFPVTLLNIILLTSFCALFNVAIGLYPFYKSYIETTTLLKEKFGKIEFTKQGIVPEKHKKEKGTVINDDLFRIDYFPKTISAEKYHPDKIYHMGIYWSPENILFWMRISLSNDRMLVIPLLIPIKHAAAPEEIMKYFNASKNSEDINLIGASAKFYKVQPDEFSSFGAKDFSDFKTNIFMFIPITIPTLYALYLFFFIVFNIIFSGMLYLIFFAAFAYFFSRGGGMKLTFSELFKTAVYTAVPGFIIATLYSGLNLPYLDFQTVFLISYFIYYFPVFARLKNVFVSKN
jgi:hypothetical protein